MSYLARFYVVRSNSKSQLVTAALGRIVALLLVHILTTYKTSTTSSAPNRTSRIPSTSRNGYIIISKTAIATRLSRVNLLLESSGDAEDTRIVVGDRRSRSRWIAVSVVAMARDVPVRLCKARCVFNMQTGEPRQQLFDPTHRMRSRHHSRSSTKTIFHH